MAARRTDPNSRAHTSMRRLAWCIAVAIALAGCIAPDSKDATNTTIDVDRANRTEGDVETEVGQSVEVFGLTATVIETGRVAAYSDIDNRGYIWASVKVENTSNREITFRRRHFQLEKPDGTLANTANVSTESQVEGSSARGDVLDPGEIREGKVIFSVGSLEGQFAIVYSPESPSGDPLDRARGVWVFQSGPDDAE